MNSSRLTVTLILLILFAPVFAAATSAAGNEERNWTVWGSHGNQKFWKKNYKKYKHLTPVNIQSAKNEWEPFQIVINSHAKLNNVRLKASELSDKQGNVIAAPTVYRQHYYDVTETANTTYGRLGYVPDALVPVIHPQTKAPTSGKYGAANLKMAKDDLEAFWFDLFVNENTASGMYTGTVTVSADGVQDVVVPVRLRVFDFTLSKQKKLRACFQTSESSLYRINEVVKNGHRHFPYQYDEMLHAHYIDNWSPITGWEYGTNKARVSVRNGKVEVDWTQYDKLVEPYLTGEAYADKVPIQCLVAPYWVPIMKNGKLISGIIYKINHKNVRYDLLEQYFAEVQRHFKEKGWLDKVMFFYFDEPFVSPWKYESFVKVSKIMRRAAPDIRIMVTDGYRGKEQVNQFVSEPIEKYVDIWNPVTFQVASPELMRYYQNRKKQGKFDLWCQTLANANPKRGVINLFPEYDMPFHRMWGYLSWKFGFQGLEWWETAYFETIARGSKDPWVYPIAFPGFNQPINGDGRFFYPGTPDRIGGPHTPISSLRMKAVREAIEDYEYMHMLTSLGGPDAEQKFAPRLHTLKQGEADKMKDAMPMGKGPWHWWEGDADAFMQLRQEIALEIEKYSKNKK